MPIKHALWKSGNLTVSQTLDPMTKGRNNTHRFIKSAGPLIPAQLPLPPGPLDSITPLPPVTLTTSLALVRKFCRCRLDTSGDVFGEEKNAGRYGSSNCFWGFGVRL
jgi:hypothetical protein